MNEMNNFVNSSFSSFAIKYCPRDCNKIAHAIAALGCNDQLHNILSWDDVPPEVVKLVTSDLTGIVFPGQKKKKECTRLVPCAIQKKNSHFLG
jgi:hypothetical protein